MIKVRNPHKPADPKKMMHTSNQSGNWTEKEVHEWEGITYTRQNKNLGLGYEYMYVYITTERGT